MHCDLEPSIFCRIYLESPFSELVSGRQLAQVHVFQIKGMQMRPICWPDVSPRKFFVLEERAIPGRISLICEGRVDGAGDGDGCAQTN